MERGLAKRTQQILGLSRGLNQPKANIPANGILQGVLPSPVDICLE